MHFSGESAITIYSKFSIAAKLCEFRSCVLVRERHRIDDVTFLSGLILPSSSGRQLLLFIMFPLISVPLFVGMIRSVIETISRWKPGILHTEVQTEKQADCYQPSRDQFADSLFSACGECNVIRDTKMYIQSLAT